MGHIKDRTGHRFGRLVLRHFLYRQRGLTYWVVECDCGTVKPVALSNLRSGAIQSCGCLSQEQARARAYRHGQSHSPTYACWAAMHQRVKRNLDYVSRGIRVCARWSHPSRGFINFLADMGERPPGHTVDRIDNQKGYTPRNCRWATRTQQCQNQRSNVMITWNGETHCASVWARRLGVPPKTFRLRVSRGWPLEKLMTTKRFNGRLLTFGNRTQLLSAWAKEQGLALPVVFNRVAAGWTLLSALELVPKELHDVVTSAQLDEPCSPNHQPTTGPATAGLVCDD